MSGFKVESLDHVAIEVSDLDAAEHWYAETLGLDRVHPEWDPPRVMAAGGTGVALFPASEGEGDGFTRHLPHIAFRVDRDSFDVATRELATRGLELRESDHGIAHSIYFTDPDGHRLELTTYDV
jgi:catechol 2,3-dioxygenase-like lactoylglutathione lyase family enzyme